VEWQRVAASTDVSGDGFVPARVAGVDVVLARLSDGTVVAFGAECPHQGQRLEQGCLWRDTVECPHHHYTFDPRTGENRGTGADRVPRLTRRLPVYDARDRDGMVEVRPPSR
jgi:nitrite reductase/ring-hydroxylating ferredoxin subunit